MTNRLQIPKIKFGDKARTAGGIFLIALVIRLVYLLQVSRSPTFLIPLVDSGAYDGAAGRLAAHGTMSIQFFWQAFFYPLFLSFVYFIFGHSIIAAKLLQALLGSLVCAMTFHLGEEIFDRRTGILAALITAFYGPLIFFGGELLATTWASFWALALLLILIRASERKSAWIYLLLGITGGLSIITRATFLPFFVISCFWLGHLLRRASFKWKKIALAELHVIVGFMLIIVPTSIECYRVTGLFSPLPETGPINLYIGNNPERSEIMALRPGGDWEDLMLMPIREGFQKRNQAQEYFMRKVITYMRTQPIDFLKRLGRKTTHFLTTREIPNNTDIYANREYSSLYAILTWKWHGFGFPFGLVLPFAVIGLILKWRAIPTFVKLFLLLYPLSIILVFVTSRYRAPMIPVLATIAAAGILGVFDAIKGRQRLKTAVLSAGVITVPILTSMPGPFAAELVNFKAELHHYVALYHLDHNNPGEAIRELRKALQFDPEYSEAFQSLGVAYAREGNLDEAYVCFKKAATLDPGYFSAQNNLGSLLGRQGKNEEALIHLKKALELNPVSDTILFNIGIALFELGRRNEAQEYFRRALTYAELYKHQALIDKIKTNFGSLLFAPGE